MFQFRPTLEAFEQRLAPAAVFVKVSGYTIINAIILPPSDGGTTTTPIPPTPTVPPPPPPPSTGGM